MARRGFALLEVLVAALLVAVAVTAVMGGLRALSAADVKASQAEMLQRLAEDKANEVQAALDPNTVADSGDFTDEGYPGVSWTISVEPSGSDYVDQVSVTAHEANASQTITYLHYVRPETGTQTQ